jgi:hypothetical protein
VIVAEDVELTRDTNTVHWVVWNPFLYCVGDELRCVVGPNVSGNALQDEEVGQNVDHIDRLELAGDTDRQAFVGE